MLKRIKNLLKDNLLFFAVFITIFIAFLSLMKVPHIIPYKITHIDKLQHLTAYFVLTLSWLYAIKKVAVVLSRKYIIVISCVFYGILLEVLQMTLTTYRTADYLDMIANSVGVVLALLIFNHFSKKNQLI